MIRDFSRALRMMERTLDGVTQAECAKEFGVTRSRVGGLVRWTTSLLLHPKRLDGETPPEHDYYSLIERRAHADFWRRQIEKARVALRHEGSRHE